MTTDTIDQPASAIAEYSATEAGLAELRQRLSGVVFALETTEGNRAARAARLELVTLRTDLEKRRKALKDPVLELGKRIDAEAKRITAEILAIEAPIDEQIRADEARREKARQERAAAEQRRIDAILRRIGEIMALANAAGTASSGSIGIRLAKLDTIVIDDSFAEFAERAQATVDEVRTTLTALRDAALEREAEAARLAAEREALRVEREAQAARDREARAKIEAERRAEEERAAAARAAEEARVRAERESEEQRVRAERDRLAAELAEQKRIADEALRAERQRQEAELQRQREAAAAAQAIEDARLAKERAEIEAARAEQQRIEDEQIAAEIARDNERMARLERVHRHAEAVLDAAEAVLRHVDPAWIPRGSQADVAMTALRAAVEAATCNGLDEIDAAAKE